jgi:hypothetical protein
MTYTPSNTPEENRRMAETIGTHLDRNGGLLLVAITGTSKTNMSYRLKVRLAYNTPNGVDVMSVTYWLASELKRNLTDDDEIRFTGLGYDRAHDVAYTIALILSRYGFAYSSQNLPKWKGIL